MMRRFSGVVWIRFCGLSASSANPQRPLRFDVLFLPQSPQGDFAENAEKTFKSTTGTLPTLALEYIAKRPILDLSG